jgi:peptidoglycan/LPS O-acetylase OafA/YrhL
MNAPVSPRIQGLDLLRSIAILGVMLFHTRGTGLPFDAVGRFGWMGVDLFFVLSGYLIGSQLLRPWSRGERPSMGGFYLRRAFRILPAYLVVLALYFLVPEFRNQPGISPLWQFLTFTVNLKINYFTNHAFSHAWSLCVEEHFYLVLPLLTLWMMRKPSLRKTLWVAGAIVIFGMIIRAWTWQYLHARYGADFDTFVTLYVEKIYYPTYTRLDGLLMGVLLATMRWFRPGWWSVCMRRANMLLAAGLAISAVGVWLFTERFSFLATVIGFPIVSLGFALLVLSAASHRSWIGRFRVWGAETTALLSYSLYLSHKGVIHLDGMYLARFVDPGGAQAVVVYAVTTFAFAALLYRLVERPFLKLRERVQPGRIRSLEVVALEDPAI